MCAITINPTTLMGGLVTEQFTNKYKIGFRAMWAY